MPVPAVLSSRSSRLGIVQILAWGSSFYFPAAIERYGTILTIARAGAVFAVINVALMMALSWRTSPGDIRQGHQP